MNRLVVPWSEIPDRKWVEVGKPIAAHEFCKRLKGKIWREILQNIMI